MFQVFVPLESPAGVRVGVHLRDRDNQWFEALLPSPVIPDQWNTFALDLTAANVHNLKALGHETTWTDYTRQRLREIGIHIYGTPLAVGKSPPLTVKLRDIHTVSFDRPAAPKTRMELFDPSTQKNMAFASEPPRVSRGGLWECS